MSPSPADHTAQPSENLIVERRKGGADRRQAHVERRELDRRGNSAAVSQYDRRRGPGRRRTDYRRAAEEGEMTEEQLAFIMAMDEYKRVNNRPYPTLTEILDVVLYLGYRKVADVGEHKLTKGRQTPVRRSRDDAPEPGAPD